MILEGFNQRKKYINILGASYLFYLFNSPVSITEIPEKFHFKAFGIKKRIFKRNI